MNNITLIGRLTRDVELNYLDSGTAIARFSMAVDRDYKNKDGTTTTDFIPVEIMGKAAEFCANYITKGRLVGISGSIRVDRYETSSGEKRTFTKVSARSIKALDKFKDDANTYKPSEVVSNMDFSATEDDEIPF